MGAVEMAPPPPPVSLNEVKAFLRIAHQEEDALIAGLVRSAADVCEAFTGCALIERAVAETVAAGGAWVRLGAGPVRAIESVVALAADGAEAALPADAYAIDVDAHGAGWVRAAAPGVKRVRVRYRVGLAGDPNGVPEALRQGTVRLAAHLYAQRGEVGGAPPAAVTALWRPWRQVRLG